MRKAVAAAVLLVAGLPMGARVGARKVLVVAAVAVGLLCPVHYADASGAQGRSSATMQKFHGNCYAFRSYLWKLNQFSSHMYDVYDQFTAGYDEYPPGPDTDTTPPDKAISDLEVMQFVLESTDSNHPGILILVAAVALHYGVKNPWGPGPYNWAVRKVFTAAYSLDLAIKAEEDTIGAGQDNYAYGRQNLSNAWDALKQLPCKKKLAATLTRSVAVSPKEDQAAHAWRWWSGLQLREHLKPGPRYPDERG